MLPLCNASVLSCFLNYLYLFSLIHLLLYIYTCINIVYNIYSIFILNKCFALFSLLKMFSIQSEIFFGVKAHSLNSAFFGSSDSNQDVVK